MEGSPSEVSLVDSLAALRRAGFSGDFSVADGGLLCSVCGQLHRAGEAEVVDLVRFEGMSDPDDEAILFALRCVHCGAKGALVATYGPAVSAEEADVLVNLQDARRR